MKATKYSQFLQNRENLQYVDTPHWIYIFEAAIVCVVIMLAGIWINGFIIESNFVRAFYSDQGIGALLFTVMGYVALIIKWGAVAFALGYFLNRVTFFMTTYVFASERRLYIKTGLIMARVDELNFEEIKSVEVNYGFFGRFLGYGKTNMDARFVKDTEIPFVYNPEKLQKLINYENDLVKDVNLSFATQGMNDGGQIHRISESDQNLPKAERQKQIIQHYEQQAAEKHHAQAAEVIEHDFEEAVLDDGTVAKKKSFHRHKATDSIDF